MTKAPAKKTINPVKFLAFRQLMADGKGKFDVRAILGMGERTYHRYLSAYRDHVRRQAAAESAR